MKHSRIRVYDNGGKTADRYTLAMPSLDHKYMNEYHCFNESPFHPQGIGMYCGEYAYEHSYKHLGKITPIESLPEQARKFVMERIKEYKETKRAN